MVNRHKCLAVIQSFVEKELGKRPFQKYAQRHTFCTPFSQPVVGKLDLCVVTSTLLPSTVNKCKVHIFFSPHCVDTDDVILGVALGGL